MISFTDDRLYVKGTCNVICSDPETGDIKFQSNKMSTGSITPSTNLNEIRAGLGNPIAAMIPSDSGLAVDFDAADFSMWAKTAQLGARHSYGSPAPYCKTVTATGTSLTIPVTDGIPVAGLGQSSPKCYVQEVGAASKLLTDGIAYDISAEGAISDFVAVSGKQYKVWYNRQKVAAQVSKISSLIDPSVVRFEAQIAVYSNKGAANNEGTRVGWLYYIIPFLKMQGDATISGDQSNNDTTKISGQAIAYDSEIVSANCADCDTSDLGYIVYVPDDEAGAITGLAVVGGVVAVPKSTSVKIPVRFVMLDGSLVRPEDTQTGFTYQKASGSATIGADGTVTATATAEDIDVTVSYTDGTNSYTCVVTVSIS